MALRNNSEFPQEHVFANVLLSGINAGLYNAYTTDDSNELQSGIANSNSLPQETDLWAYSDSSLPELYFTHPLGNDELKELVSCSPALLSAKSRIYLNFYAKHRNDSSEFQIEEPIAKKETKIKDGEKVIPIYDTAYVMSCVYPQQIDQYLIVEDWLFDKSKGQMVVRIAAIAPSVAGKPLFGLRYPDIRKYIAQYEVYAGKKDMGLNWDEYFESRKFSSRIIKTGK